VFKPTTPDLGGKIFSALMAFLAVAALAGTIWIVTGGQYSPAATVLCAGVTVGLAVFAVIPWVPRRDE
jgi:hypothetical protein